MAVPPASRSTWSIQDRGELELGPDLVIGYARGTRIANPSILGEMAAEVFSDNTR